MEQAITDFRLGTWSFYPHQPSDMRTFQHNANVRHIYRALLAKKDWFTFKEMGEFKQAYGMNSYEQDMMVCRLTARSLLEYADHLYAIGDIHWKVTLSECYSDAIVSRVAPLLMDRLNSMLLQMENIYENEKKIHDLVMKIHERIFGP